MKIEQIDQLIPNMLKTDLHNTMSNFLKHNFLIYFLCVYVEKRINSHAMA